MRSKIITAKFKGQNGSLGYKSGEKYSIKITHKNDSNILIERTDGSGKCEYQSLIAFLDNWDNMFQQSTNKKKMERRYDVLCEDVKYQMDFLNDINTFDFDYLKDMLSEMKSIQEKLTK